MKLKKNKKFKIIFVANKYFHLHNRENEPKKFLFFIHYVDHDWNSQRVFFAFDSRKDFEIKINKYVSSKNIKKSFLNYYDENFEKEIIGF